MEQVFQSIGISRLRIGTDGEGVTTLVAGYGCPLRCKYCLNPQCFSKNYKFKSHTVSDLIEELKIDSLYFEATGGGVVFGGGEPLLQPEFIRAFHEVCPDTWHIMLETSLNIPTDNLLQVADFIDYYLIDIKDMNPDIYRAYTGKTNELVLYNLALLRDLVSPEKVCIRLPEIPEYNTKEDIESSKTLLSEMGFTNFDVFSYNCEYALKKATQI